MLLGCVLGSMTSESMLSWSVWSDGLVVGWFIYWFAGWLSARSLGSVVGDLDGCL